MIRHIEDWGSQRRKLATVYWDWEDAFYKFGFGDGDGEVQTWRVAAALRDAGYTVECLEWGLHNTVITSMRRGDKELLPLDDAEVEFGYDDPRCFLLGAII